MFAINGRKRTSRHYRTVADAMPYLRQKRRDGLSPYYVTMDYQDGYWNPIAVITMTTEVNVMTPGFQRATSHGMVMTHGPFRFEHWRE